MLLLSTPAQSTPTTNVSTAAPAANLVGIRQNPDGTLSVVEVGSDSFLAATGKMLALEPEIEFRSLELATDPRRSSQWGFSATTIEAAWQNSTGAGTKVAILDSGLRSTHEDLRGAILTGADFVNPAGGDGSGPDYFHGTHVAGIVAAQRNNGVGIAGVAPDAKILPVRVLNQNGSGTSSNVARGIIWSVEHGADVINLSLGGDVESTVVTIAVDYALENGVVVVAAAGNTANSGNPVIYPAATAGVIGVGAIDPNLSRSTFSSFGPMVSVVAPGRSITSAAHDSDTGYATASGTSMASPYVAGVAALIKSIEPELSANDVALMITRSAIDLGPPGRDDEYGFGFIDPYAATNMAVGLTPRPAPAVEGYGVVTNKGRFVAFGTAKSYGSMYGRGLANPVVGAVSTQSGNGYYMVGSDGGIFAYGDAQFYGSTGNLALNSPIVGMASTPTGNGYWLVASDGGIFAYGDAQFYGSTGNLALNSPIVGMASTPTGNGYWLVASDGGIFAYGDAQFYGSAAGVNSDNTASAIVPSAAGYWLLSPGGQVQVRGDASYEGDGGTYAAGEFSVALVWLR